MATTDSAETPPEGMMKAGLELPGDTERVTVVGYVLADWGKAIARLAAQEVHRTGRDGHGNINDPERGKAVRSLYRESQRLARVLAELPSWSDNSQEDTNV